MRDELTSLLTFVLDLLRDFGLDDFYLELSTKDPDKYVGEDAIWELATRTLEEAGMPDVLIVCGGTQIRNAVDGNIKTMLADVAAQGVPLGGICTGAVASSGRGPASR